MTRLALGNWNPVIHAQLLQLLDQQRHKTPAPVATLDWDNTCIRGDIGEAFVRALGTEKRQDIAAHYQEIYSAQGAETAYAYAATRIVGMTEEEVKLRAESVIADGLNDGSLRFRPDIQQLISALTDDGWMVWIVSASATAIVQPFAKLLGLPAERVIGVSVEQDEQGRFTQTLAAEMTYRKGKVSAIEKHIRQRPILAIGDAKTDIEMLQFAQSAILIDRGDLELRRLAKTSAWWLQMGW